MEIPSFLLGLAVAGADRLTGCIFDAALFVLNFIGGMILLVKR
jgi:hypothetical protein